MTSSAGRHRGSGKTDGARRLASQGGPYSQIFDEPAGRTGPLHGVSVAVKDIFAMSGRLTRLGSASQASEMPSASDAAAVARLRQAGATFVGKTAMHELALGVTGVNHFEGTPTNPLEPDRVPGGSSSGSAVAVAEGTAAVAIGSDTGGSARIPAAFCGVVGFKSQRDVALKAGLFPLAPTLDHLGILARDVATVQRTWAVLSNSASITRPSRRAWEYMLDADAIGDADTEVARAIEEALRVIGRRIRPIRFAFSSEIVEVSSTILLYEASRVHAERLALRADRIGPDVLQRLQVGSAITVAEYRDALGASRVIRKAYLQVMKKDRALLGPTVGSAPPLLVDPPPDVRRLVRSTRLANLLGVPAISLPLRCVGAPLVGLQLVGGTDEALLALAGSFERKLNDVSHD